MAGNPAPQGSITAVVIALVATAQSRVRCPRCRTPLRGITNMISDNKSTGPWRELVAGRAAEAMTGRDVLTGAVSVYLDVAVARPKTHYRTGKFAHRLRDDARPEPTGAQDGDLDKIARAVGDALTGVVYGDDCQVVEYTRLRMHWAGEKPDGLSVPGARIVITQL